MVWPAYFPNFSIWTNVVFEQHSDLLRILEASNSNLDLKPTALRRTSYMVLTECLKSGHDNLFSYNFPSNTNYIIWQYRHAMISAVFAFWKIRRQSKLSVHILNHVRIHKAVQLESEFQHTGTWSAAGWLPHRLCYRPTVFTPPPSSRCTFTPAKTNSGAFQVCSCVNLLTSLKSCIRIPVRRRMPVHWLIKW